MFLSFIQTSLFATIAVLLLITSSSTSTFASAQGVDITCVVACPSGYYNTTPYNTTCVACPVHHTCAGGGAAPVACLTGQQSVAASGPGGCTNCITPICGLGPGLGCISPNARGYYRSAGAAPYTCLACPAGTYNSANNAPVACTSAPAGTYVNAARDGTLPCSAGYACPSKTVDKEVACPAGTYSDDGAAAGCVACESGYACPSTSLQCAAAASSRIRYACPLGSYSTGSQETCTLCPQMHYCPDPTTATIIPCATGTWSTLGQATCSVCPVGLACGAGGTQTCTVGQYSNVTHCMTCPAGFSCATAGVRVACPSGSYALAGATSCTTCPAGYECPSSDKAPVECTQGFYSYGGLTNCIQCNSTLASVAVYTVAVRSTQCNICPAGSYCPNSYENPILCPRGFAAGGGNYSCTSCAALYPNVGTYTIGTGSSDCVMCPSGFYCPAPDQSPKPCPAGTFSTGASHNCTLCPRGSECPSGSGMPIACPTGSYSGSGYAKCRTCPQNSQCPTPSMDPIPCDMSGGFFSTPGSTSCVSCPAGYSCNFSSSIAVFEPCPAGTYRSGVTCRICPSGFMCPTTDGSPLRCPKGSYSWVGSTTCYLCPAGMRCGNQTTPIPCQPGYYSLLGETICNYCPPGHSCSTTFDAPVRCLDGTYAEGGATNCTRCPAGWACPLTNAFAGSAFRCAEGTTSAGGQLQCIVCRAGHYCPTIYQNLEIPCPSGYYSAASSSNCTICPVGYACPSADYSLQPPIACAVGTFSTGGQTSCNVCPAGFACPSTTQDTMITCANGTWTIPGMPACAVCKAGYYCPQTAVSASQPLIGPVGIGREVPCALGTYSQAGAVECTKCPRGFVCTSPSSADGNATACPAGSFTAIGQIFSEFGATNCQVCPAGADCSVSGNAPSACPPGTYATVSGCLSCPGGFSCETASSPPRPCPAGQYSSNNSLQCTSCAPGYACPPQSTTSTPAGSECPLGSYCPAGTPVPVPCPSGTYGLTTAAGTIGVACGTCIAGMYCPLGTAGTAAMVLCPRGHYCPNGAGFAHPCPSGTYSSSQKATSRATCRICPEGYFCPSGSYDFVPNPCPAGYFCPAGTGGPYDNGCPPGTFSSDSKLTSVMQCQQCLTGHSCSSSGMNSPLPCNIGQYQDLPGQVSCKSCEAGWACPRAGLASFMTTTCSPGHFCPRGTGLPTSNPCPGGTYTFRKNLQEAGECEICWRGFYCSPGTGLNPATPLPCAVGHYCPGVPKEGRRTGTFYYLAEFFGNSAAQSTQYPCPQGTLSSATDLWAPEQCTDCPEGSFCVGGGSTVSGTCAAGHFCPRGSAFAQQVPCPPGTWKPSAGSVRESDCEPCQPGYYCPAGSISMIPCPQGTYTPWNRTYGQGPALGFSDGQCILCPAGYACPVGATNPTTCPTGSYSAPGSGVCRSCEAGRYCPQNATSEEAKEKLYLCPAGLFCAASLARLPSPVYDLCPAGYYCPIGTTTPVACPPGTMNAAEGRTSLTECLLCPPGYYCAETAAVNATGECSPGYYCPPGSTTPTQEPCPARFFRSTTRAESEDFCQACPKGEYCPPGTATPLTCPIGYYCPCGTGTPVPCPIGTYGNATGLYAQTQCTPCTPGYYCDGLGLSHPTGLCDPGYYCVSRAFTSAPPGLPTGGKCPKGGYCPAGSAFPTACAEGTFNNFTGGSTQQDCTACTPGYYCSGSNLPFPTGPCSAGYYCTGGAAVPTQFRTPAGSFSLPGAPAPEPCPLGTYNPLPAQGSCLACVKGNYCPRTGLVNYLPCPSGSYCPPASVTPRACPLGTFQPELSRTNISQCINCLPGMYCADINSTLPTGPCRAGFYCKRNCITAQCSLYLQNYLVVTNLPTNPGFENNIGGQCPYGHYCPNATSIPIQCPVGTYRDAVQATSNVSCTACAAGYYCPTTGMSFLLPAPATPSPCTAGYYCPGNIPGTTIGCTDATCSTYYGNPCDLEQFGCHGTTNTDLASTTPAPRLCPSGFYCPSASALPQRCMPQTSDNKATWNAERGKAGCDICPAGFFCDYNNVTTLQVAQECPAGKYCPPGTGGVQPLCPEGSWSNQVRLMNRTGCNRCPAGRYCPDKGINTLTTATAPFCFGGFYCTSGALDGFGRWSVLGGRGGICPAGYFCPNGTKYNTSYPCPPGTYKPTLGGSSSTSCLACDAGKFCSGPGNAVVTGDCAAGYYCPRACSDNTCSNQACTNGILAAPAGLQGGPCPAGFYCPIASGLPTKCPVGTYQPAEGQSSCIQCPAGYYCGDATIYPVICPRGHYCPNGTSALAIPKCPRGSYRATTGAANLTECDLCAPGHFCPFLGMNATLPLCSPGYYCTAGAMDQFGVPGQLGGEGGICPKGYYCTRGTPYNTSYPCPPGTYNSVTGAKNHSACLPCTGGFACVGYSVVNPTLVPCKAGFYCPMNCSDDMCTNFMCLGSCSAPYIGGICPVGHYCPQFNTTYYNNGARTLSGAIMPIPCPNGTYADTQGLSQCIICPPGVYCPTGSVTPLGCPIGHYCPGNNSFPLPCPPGSIGPLVNQTTCDLCPGGSYCSNWAESNVTGDCAAGYFCAAGANDTAGNVGVLPGSSAGPCPTGHFCPTGTNVSTSYPCWNGTYNPDMGASNASACRPCDPGMYCPSFGQSASLLKCNAGYFCPRGCSDATCSNMPCTSNCADYDNSPYLLGGVCPAGFYCPQTATRGAILPIACPPGTRAPQQGLDACVPCPEGYYCGTASVNGTLCPLGRYCPANTTLVIPNCPEGSYNDLRGGSNLSDCVLCLSGQFCARRGNHSTTAPCNPGYYCTSGAKDAFGAVGPLGGSGGICAKGHYCPEGSTNSKMVACPNTTHNPILGATNSSYCLTCPAGYFCQNMGQENVSAPCAPGYFCKYGCGNAQCTNNCLGNCSVDNQTGGGPCPLGYICPQASVANSTLSAMPTQQMGVTTIIGNINPIPCAEGTYTPREASTNCSACPQGYFCLAGNINPIPQICPAGYYCPNGTTSVSMVPCPNGTFSAATGLVNVTQCQRCTAGHFCSQPALTTPNGLCGAGYFCPGGASDQFGTPGIRGVVTTKWALNTVTLAQDCPRGYYCPTGSALPLLCPVGRFNPNPNGRNVSISCRPCTGGFYCLGAVNDTVDPIPWNVSGPCAPGYACPAGCFDAQCINHLSFSALGMYTTTIGENISMSGVCPPGTYCPGQTVVPIACPAGTLSSSWGASKCAPCPAGFYCPSNSSAGIPCPRGNYCPQNSTGVNLPQCPVGSFGNTTQATVMNNCSRCAPGQACTTTGLIQPDILCDAGYYCRSGAANSTANVGVLGGDSGLCPRGHYCPQGTSSPTPCPIGTFNPENGSTNASACLFCPPGYYCSGTGKATVTGICNGGYWCQLGASLPNSTSDLCPRGYFCPAGTAQAIGCQAGSFNPFNGTSSRNSCLACPAGYYCLANSSETSGICTAGYYCLVNSTVPNPASGECPIGSYCPAGSPSAILCTPGSYCDNVRLPAPTGYCNGGYYCTRNASVPNPTDNVTGNICPAGSYCPVNSSTPTPCSAGMYGPSIGQSSSFACRPCIGGRYCPSNGMSAVGPQCYGGFYCPYGQLSATPSLYMCNIGYYCPNGTSAQLRCAPGYYSDAPQLSQCKLCPNGYFCNPKNLCPSNNFTQPEMCPEGYYCPNGTAIATDFPCPTGTWSNRTGLTRVSGCNNCTPGYFCPALGQIVVDPAQTCYAGYYCKSRAIVPNPTDNITGNICPAGYYCPNATGAPLACPVGTFSAATGLMSQSQCQICTAGSYCATMGLTAPTGLCSAGYYCPAGSTAATQIICTWGYACPIGSAAALRCPSGRYAVGYGQPACSICPAGKYCDVADPCLNGTGTNVELNYTCQRECPTGYYCPAGTNFSTQFSCPAATMGNLPGLTSVLDCTPCSPGYYCPSAGTTDLTKQPCTAGFWCISNSSVSAPVDGVRGVVCPAGYYCPQGTPNPISCQPGTYNPSPGGASSNACLNCTAGKACTIANLTAPDADCQAGYYCPGGQATTTPSEYPCPLGFYCTAGLISPIPCSSGTTTTILGQSMCSPCPAGFYCTWAINGTTAESCVPGHYCPRGTNISTENPCPPGTYSDSYGNSRLSNCSACPLGRGCPLWGHVSPLPDCNKGYYCVSGAATTTPTDGITGDLCPSGGYCPAGTLAPVGCPPGTFNNDTGLMNETQCTPCSAGKYCGSSNMTTPSGPCAGGWYCPSGQATDTPASYICPEYKYCPTGSAAPVDCPDGSYTGAGDINRATCRPCAEGFFCNLNLQQLDPWNLHGNYTAPVTCPTGHYCPLGTGTPLPCPAGTYNNITGLVNQSQCALCPPGFYCFPEGRVNPTGLCFAGHYCSLGSATAEPAPPSTVGGVCPVGRYCVTGSTADMGQPCPAGTYYGGRGAKNVTACGPCSAGYYCETPGANQSFGDGPCPAGYFCPGQTAQGTDPEHLCPRGHYCPAGSAVAIPCPAGNFSDVNGSTSCQVCPEGTYCPHAAIAPINCTAPQICPAASKLPKLCANGTYNSQNLTVFTSQSQCSICPAGKYCTNGEITGDCAAGYYCEYGNDKPDPTPDVYIANVKKGGICPLGYYCVAGTTSRQPCSNQTVGFSTGLQRASDCQVCQPGYYCLQSSVLPIDCPKGYYCPGLALGTQSIIACPRGTYQPVTRATDISYCLPCKAGFYCPSEAMTTSATFATPEGFYSTVGQSEPYACPGGTYQPQSAGNASNTSACVRCPVGYYCGPESAAFKHVCPEGTFCPQGSTYPFHCPGGSYCPYLSAAPITCPEGYFCPALSTSPQLCWNGTYCPAGSESPLLCPAGTVSRNDTVLRYNAQDSCVSCPAGFWSSNSLWCEPCSAGYVCLGGTNTRYPITIDVDKGYICPVGYYCPTGASSPSPCPPGRFNNRTGGRTINACLKCDAGYYNPNFAQTGCSRCGSSSTSPAGSVGCDCIGKFRVFQPDDRSCRCIPGYQFFADGTSYSEEDSPFTCQPIVYPRCPPGQFRSAGGNCIDPLNRDHKYLLCQMCADPQAGIIDTQMGICTCNEIQSEDQVCDEKCRNEANTISIDTLTNTLRLTNTTTGEVTTLDLAAAAALGDKSCGLDRSNCTVRTMIFSSNGPLGVYNPTTSLFLKANTTLNTTSSSSSSSLNRRIAFAQEEPFAGSSSSSSRRASLQGLSPTNDDARTITNPVVCLNLGDTMMFDVSDPSRTHFPIYLKDSLLNTNPNFDYTAFRNLKEKMRDPNLTISVFLYSFDDPGVYVFADNANTNLISIIRVVTINERCPSTTFMAVTQGSLVITGVDRNSGILLEPDWILIGALSGGLLLLVIAIIAGLWHFRRQSWDHLGSTAPRYRDRGLNLLKGKAAALASKGTHLRKTQLLANGEERLNTPPGSSAAITLRLDAPFRDFDAEDFVKYVAADMEVDPEYVLILSVTEGSTIVRFVVTGTPNAQSIADSFLERLEDEHADIREHLPILAYDTTSPAAGNDHQQRQQHQQQRRRQSNAQNNNNNGQQAGFSIGGGYNDPDGFNVSLLEDEFWDYERQIDLEGFNVRTLYDKLEDQTIHVVAQLSNQRDDLLLLCDKILVESEALKEMFLKIKLDLDDRARREKALKENVADMMNENNSNNNSNNVAFQLPEDLKLQVAGFLNGFFDRWLGALATGGFKNLQNPDDIIRAAEEQRLKIEENPDYYNNNSMMMTNGNKFNSKQSKTAEQEALELQEELHNTEALSLGLETDSKHGRLHGGKGLHGGAGEGPSSRFASKTAIDLGEFPSEIRDDSDDEDDDRLARADLREKNLRMKLGRLRRRMDEISMPLGLSNDAIIPGVTTEDEAKRIREERKAYLAARRAEREHVDDTPDYLKDQPKANAKVRIGLANRRQVQLFKRLRELRQALADMEFPENMRDSDSLSPAEREARRLRRDKFMEHRLNAARRARADATVPLELCDDSDLEPEKRKDRHDAAEDRAGTLRARVTEQPNLPSAKESGISAALKNGREKLSDKVIMDRAAAARDALRELNLPEGLSDHSDLDDNEREERRLKRNKWIQKQGAKSGFAESTNNNTSGSKQTPEELAENNSQQQGQGTGAADQKSSSSSSSSSSAVIHNALNALKHSKMVDGCPVEYLDDPSLDADERKEREELRKRFLAGRNSKPDEIPPENENERGITDSERRRRQERNQAFRRGQIATFGIDAAALKEKIAELRQSINANANSSSGDMKNALELGKEQQALLELPADCRGDSAEAKLKRQAFMTGRRAATVAALPADLDQHVAGLSQAEMAERKSLAARFKTARKQADHVNFPAEIKGDADLETAFRLGRDAQRGKAVQDLADLEEGENREAISAAFTAGRHAAKLAALPDEYARDPNLRKAFAAGLAGDQEIPEELGGQNASAKVKEAFQRGQDARRAIDNAMPAELRDDVPMLSQEEIAERRRLQAIFKQGLHAAMAEQLLKEAVNATDSPARKEALKKAFQSGYKAQKLADAVPKELADALAQADLPEADRVRAQKEKAAFIRGRAAAHMAAAIQEDLDAPTFNKSSQASTLAEKNSNAVSSLLAAGAQAQRKFDEVPVEMRDAASLPEQERKHRAKLREALTAGRSAKATTSSIEELVEPMELIEPSSTTFGGVSTSSSSTGSKLGRTQSMHHGRVHQQQQFHSAGGGAAGELIEDDGSSSSSTTGAGAGRQHMSDPAAAEELKAQLSRMKKDHNNGFKKLKNKHQLETSAAMEELEDEAVSDSKKLEYELAEDFASERQRLSDKHKLDLLKETDPAKRAALEKKQQKELQDLIDSQEKASREAHEKLVSRTEEKKKKMGAVLDHKHLMEIKLQKALAQNQEQEIADLYEQAKREGSDRSEILDKDMAYQKQLLFDKLRAREKRMKAKAQKEKEFLEQQLQGTANVEREALMAELKDKEDQAIRRVEELRKRGVLTNEEAAAEIEKVKARFAKEAEIELKSLQSRQQANRLELEQELHDKQADEKQKESKLAEQEVDHLLQKAEELKKAEADAAAEEQRKLQASRAAQAAQAAMQLMLAQKKQREELEAQLAAQMELDKTSTKARAKAEAAKEIEKLERERGQKLTPEQRQAIMDEAARNAANLDAQLSDEQRLQQDETRRKIEERRRKKEQELQRKQAQEMRNEMKRQEDESRAKEADLKGKVKIEEVVVSADVKKDEKALEEKEKKLEEELKRKHQLEQEQLQKQLESELEKEQRAEIEKLKEAHKKQKMELRNKQQQHEGTGQMSAEQKADLEREHQEEAKRLESQLANEEALQQERYKAQLRARLAKKKGELTDKQQDELRDEKKKIENQRDEVVRTAQLQAEQKAIDSAVKKGGAAAQGKTEDIAQVVMAKRHREEVSSLLKKQTARRAQEKENWAKQFELEKELALAAIDTKALDEIAAISADDENADAKRAEIQAKRKAASEKCVADMDAKFKQSNLPDLEDRLEMELVQEQMQLKLRQISEISKASGVEVPKSVLEQLDSSSSSSANAQQQQQQKKTSGGLSDEEIKKQKEEAERELLEFKKAKQREQDALKERLEKEKIEYEAKLQADFERRQKEQEEEMLAREAQMRAKVETDIAAREKMVQDRLKKEGAAGGAGKDGGAGGNAANEADLRKKLIEAGKNEEERLRAAVDEEMARQRAEHEANIKARKERAAKRQQALKDQDQRPSTAEQQQTDSATASQQQQQDASKSEQEQQQQQDSAATTTTTITPASLEQVLAKVQTAAQQQQGSSSSTSTTTTSTMQMMNFAPGAIANLGAPENKEALGQWANTVVAQLQSSPIYEKVCNIERMLQKQQRSGLLSFYLDAKDRERPSNEGTLVEKKPEDLSTDKFVVWSFGNNLYKRLATNSGVRLPDVRIALAESLPKAKATMSAFRHSYFYDAPKKTLFVREARLETLGEFSVVLTHALAHIKASTADNTSAAAWSDTDPRFLTDFYGLLELVAEETFFTRNAVVERQEQQQQDRPYRLPAGSVMSAKSLKAVEDAIRNVPKAERGSALQKFLQY